MIVVRIFGRDNKSKVLDFKTKEDMSKYIADNVNEIKEIKIVSDGRTLIELITIEDKRIIRPIDCDDILEGICSVMEQCGLEQERLKGVLIVRPKKEDKNEDEK